MNEICQPLQKVVRRVREVDKSYKYLGDEAPSHILNPIPSINWNFLKWNSPIRVTKLVPMVHNKSSSFLFCIDRLPPTIAARKKVKVGNIRMMTKLSQETEECLCTDMTLPLPEALRTSHNPEFHQASQPYLSAKEREKKEKKKISHFSLRIVCLLLGQRENKTRCTCVIPINILF